MESSSRPASADQSAAESMRQGAWCSLLAAVTVGVCLVAIAIFEGLDHAYVWVLMGVAAGGAMATQVPGRRAVAGLVAMALTALVAALSVPAVAIAATMVSLEVGLAQSYAAVGGVVGAFTWVADTVGLAMALYVIGALASAFSVAVWLSERHHTH